MGEGASSILAVVAIVLRLLPRYAITRPQLFYFTERFMPFQKGNKVRLGLVHTEKTKLQMSKTATGRIITEETRHKISLANTGRTFSEEHKLKIGAAGRGRPLSEEHKRKMSETRRKIDRQFCPQGHDTHIVLRRGGRKRDLGGCVKCSYIRGAAARKILFDLTDIQFGEVINKECIYKCSKCSLTGIDRIDSAKGYVVGNIQPMCGRHNQMKSNFAREEFEILCTSVRPSVRS